MSAAFEGAALVDGLADSRADQSETGVRLVCAGLSMEARLSVSAGCGDAVDVDRHTMPYCTNAVVPRAPYRELSASECCFLTDAAITDAARTLWVVRVPPELIARIRSEASEYLSTRHWEAQHGTRMGDLTEALAAYGLHLSRASTPPTTLGVAVREPGLWTVTVNQQKTSRLGMHLDSWDGLPFSERAQARNRLCINLAQQPRFFLFAKWTIVDIAERLGLPGSSRYDASDAVRVWFRACPTEPVFRLRIDPGEAYIAPTEMIPHDASTAGLSELDVSFTMLGHFRPRG